MVSKHTGRTGPHVQSQLVSGLDQMSVNMSTCLTLFSGCLLTSGSGLKEM